MNTLKALEQLGYTNNVDFEIYATDLNTISTWKHTDPQPSQPALDAAWSAWLTTNAIPLSVLKQDAKKIVDDTAERARLRYVTPGGGQAMAYMEKGDQAADYVAAGYPVDLTTFPFIQAEVNATGKTSTQAADDILTQKSNWIIVGASVEEQRLLGKTNIDAAVDGDGVDVARDAAIVALEAI